MTIRFTASHRQEIARAARIVSRERRDIVEPSALVRELVLPGVRAIIEREQRPAA
jgi:hypothetical protein